MATSKDTGGQRQTTRRAEETEETEAGTSEESRERHEKLSDDVDAIQPPATERQPTERQH
jgi:ubiquitin-like protein Pup